DQPADERDRDADGYGDAGAPEEPRENVAAYGVGAHRMGRRWRLQRGPDVDGQRVLGPHPRTRHGRDDQREEQAERQEELRVAESGAHPAVLKPGPSRRTRAGSASARTPR